MFMCNLCGVGLVLASQGATVLFAQFDKNMPMLICGVVCFLPTFIWIKTVFFPHGDEKVHLSTVAEKRAVRRYVFCYIVLPFPYLLGASVHSATRHDMTRV
jgi:hypothetical protein